MVIGQLGHEFLRPLPVEGEGLGTEESGNVMETGLGSPRHEEWGDTF